MFPINRRSLVRNLLACSFACALTCTGDKLPKGTPTPTTYFTASTADTRFNVADHFLASIEMQVSGEPFAQLLGKNLAGYNRFSKVPDLYSDPAGLQTIVDPLSYSLAIESYEYSKQPMNNTSFESGAGLSLMFGPVLNPSGMVGDPAVQILGDRFQLFATESNSGGPLGRNFIVSPAPTNNPLNIYGWAGLWPVFAEFQSFLPTIDPAGGATRGCSFVGGYAASVLGTQVVGDYECGYTSLNLVDRDSQVTKVLSPAALGYASWKQGLWVINYWQSVHDLAGNGITSVADIDLPLVGQSGNSVIGQYPDPNDPTGVAMLDGIPGVYLGDIALEGWQGLTMIEELQNKAALLLGQVMTSDGSTLGGFSSTANALGYDYAAPLKWWPSQTAVGEDVGVPPAAGASWRVFPKPTGFTVVSASSKLHDLTALAGGFGEFFALTDFNNADVGGQLSSRATFDGDPFPADDQKADGEETPHDRALGVIKVALINLDRLHFDATNKVLVDETTVVNGAPKLGRKVTTVDAAYAILGLRTAFRSISSTIALYSNDTPDVLGGPTALDGTSFTGAPASATSIGQRVSDLLRAEADFITAKLVAADGSVANGYDLTTQKADPSPTLLESEMSAIRGLLEAYLATSDQTYRATAERVYADLEKRFWITDVRAFRTVAGESKVFTWTPIAFGALQGALRQYWKLVASAPGSERLASEILERIQRMNKLVLNGWDDANGDNVVQYPDECTGAGLQMGERALTGELSHPADTGDRDKDCVKEISVVKLPSALAAQVVLTRR